MPEVPEMYLRPPNHMSDVRVGDTWTCRISGLVWKLEAVEHDEERSGRDRFGNLVTDVQHISELQWVAMNGELSVPYYDQLLGARDDWFREQNTATSV